MPLLASHTARSHKRCSTGSKPCARPRMPDCAARVCHRGSAPRRGPTNVRRWSASCGWTAVRPMNPRCLLARFIVRERRCRGCRNRDRPRCSEGRRSPAGGVATVSFRCRLRAGARGADGVGPCTWTTTSISRRGSRASRLRTPGSAPKDSTSIASARGAPSLAGKSWGSVRRARHRNRPQEVRHR
jgi:hypothetical protein